VESFANYFCRGSSDVANINFMTSVNGFTMMDLVSYDVKHNEDNGEDNQDGTQYNYSWNCGVEGRSRKKAIVSRRMCQIRNAFAMILLAQGTPMLLAGDEFGNTQQGNNNPYCQDNAVTWLDWRQLESHREIFDYVRRLIHFRKEHPVLRQGRQLNMFDSLSCGMPDLSIHGTQAWKTDFSYYSRMLAVLLYGEYQCREDGLADDSLYIIFNMHWESQSFDLPNLPGAKEWYPVIETYGNTFSEAPKPPQKKTKKKKPLLGNRRKTVVPPRSIVVFVGR
jgi:glycogen operon protein